jgi:hypothetical protein
LKNRGGISTDVIWRKKYEMSKNIKEKFKRKKKERGKIK